MHQEIRRPRGGRALPKEAITSDGLEPVLVAGLQQVRVGDGPAGQDAPEEGQVLLGYPGEGESGRDGIGGWRRSVSLAVQPKLPPGAQLEATAGARRRRSGQNPS